MRKVIATRRYTKYEMFAMNDKKVAPPFDMAKELITLGLYTSPNYTLLSALASKYGVPMDSQIVYDLVNLCDCHELPIPDNLVAQFRAESRMPDIWKLTC